MKRYSIYLLFAILTALPACSRRELINPVDLPSKPSDSSENAQSEKYPIVFRIGEDGATKAAGFDSEEMEPGIRVNRTPLSVGTKGATPVTSLSQFYVSICSENEDAFKYENRVFSGPDSNGYYSSGLYWPATEMPYDFIVSNLSMMENVYSGTDGSYFPLVYFDCTEDLVCGYNLDSNYANSPVAIVLTHPLARIGTFTVSANGGDSSMNLVVNSCTINNCKTSGLYDIMNECFETVAGIKSEFPDLAWDSSWSDNTSSYTLKADGTNNDIWVIPGTYSMTLNYTLYSVDSSGSTLVGSGTRSASVTLKGGCVNNIEADAQFIVIEF